MVNGSSEQWNGDRGRRGATGVHSYDNVSWTMPTYEVTTAGGPDSEPIAFREALGVLQKGGGIPLGHVSPVSPINSAPESTMTTSLTPPHLQHYYDISLTALGSCRIRNKLRKLDQTTSETLSANVTSPDMPLIYPRNFLKAPQRHCNALSHSIVE